MADIIEFMAQPLTLDPAQTSGGTVYPNRFRLPEKEMLEVLQYDTLDVQVFVLACDTGYTVPSPAPNPPGASSAPIVITFFTGMEQRDKTMAHLTGMNFGIGQGLPVPILRLPVNNLPLLRWLTWEVANCSTTVPAVLTMKGIGRTRGF